MAEVWIAFQTQNDDESIPPTCQQIWCHMVFDVKMEDFHQKAWVVAGGQVTETPATNTYASVVSWESVCTTLTLAVLNNLEVKTADIKNACLTAPVSEKICHVLGPEFSANTGKHAIVVWSLYGLKSAGASFWNHKFDMPWSRFAQACFWDLCIWVCSGIGYVNWAQW
jgi:hypothetical protein